MQPKKNLLLILAIAIDTQTDAFYAPKLSAQNGTPQNALHTRVHVPERPRHRVIHANRGNRVDSRLFEQFKLRMPWDPPDQQQERKTRQAKKEEASNIVERRSAPRSRQPKNSRSSYNLYGAPPMPDDVEDHVHSSMDAAVINSSRKEQNANSPTNQQSKLGIILIDHGSKKQSSNDALHSIADRYESMLLQRLEDSTPKTSTSITVKASHMELASPSIESSLRSIIKNGATTVICVPYFLSRGRHITLDVPNLIQDAKDVLEEEGVLNDVEVVISKHLGSDVDCMLGGVDDLVRGVLDGDGDFSWVLQGDDVSSEETLSSGKSYSLEAEVRKYSNRSTLLESMLEKKVQQLRTMTNRVTILEDVLNKKLEENDLLRQRARAAGDGTGRSSDVAKKKKKKKMMANLTSTIDALVDEKTQLLSQTETLEAEMTQLENEYNSTMVELQNKISILEGKLKAQNETNAILNTKLSESQKSQQLKGEEQKNQTLAVQQQTISDLQSQLADILDAYNELEQVQNETEAAIVDYKDRLDIAKQENKQLVEEQSTQAEKYRLELEDNQKMLDEERSKSKELLASSREKYEGLLAQEKATATEWKDKWDKLNTELSKRDEHSTASVARSEEEWTKMENELQAALQSSANATNKIYQLEKELLQQRENEETSTSTQKQLEQQQQLQEYLKAQIQTYYETIQGQTAEIADYKKQIEDMQSKHEDSMLIATKSVEASQRREADLLSSVEELESELNDLQKEMSKREQKIKDIQSQLNAVEAGGNLRKGDVKNNNKQLIMEIEMLRREVDTVSDEKKRILDQKVRLEAIMIDRALGEERNTEKIAGEAKAKRKRWRTYLLRPWSLLRRQ